MKKYTSLAACAAVLIAPLSWGSSSTIEHQIDAGLLTITADATINMGANQTVTATGVPSIEKVSTISVSDLRGTETEIFVDVEVTPLTNAATGKVRGTSVVAQNAGGDTTGTVSFSSAVTAAEDSAGTATGSDFVTTSARYNRAFTFDIAITALALARNEAHTGAYTGTVELTVR